MNINKKEVNMKLEDLKKMIGTHKVHISTTSNSSPFNKGRGDESFISKFGYSVDDIVKESDLECFGGSEVHYRDLIAEQTKQDPNTIEVKKNKIGDWVEGYEGIALANDKGDIYLRLYSKNGNNKVKYFHEKEEINIRDPKYSKYLKPKFSKDKKDLLVMNIKLNSINKMDIE